MKNDSDGCNERKSYSLVAFSGQLFFRKGHKLNPNDQRLSQGFFQTILVHSCLAMASQVFNRTTLVRSCRNLLPHSICRDSSLYWQFRPSPLNCPIYFVRLVDTWTFIQKVRSILCSYWSRTFRRSSTTIRIIFQCWWKLGTNICSHPFVLWCDAGHVPICDWNYQYLFN